jgi:hypothetical protein
VTVFAARWTAWALLILFAGCRTPSSQSAVPPATASDALAAFIEAADAGDFRRAYELLSGDWRARYTPERLKSDFEAEPLAKERLERARVALAQPPVVRGDVAEFPIGAGKAVRLVKENGNFRVATLE